MSFAYVSVVQQVDEVFLYCSCKALRLESEKTSTKGTEELATIGSG